MQLLIVNVIRRSCPYHMIFLDRWLLRYVIESKRMKKWDSNQRNWNSLKPWCETVGLVCAWNMVKMSEKLSFLFVLKIFKTTAWFPVSLEQSSFCVILGNSSFFCHIIPGYQIYCSTFPFSILFSFSPFFVFVVPDLKMRWDVLTD